MANILILHGPNLNLLGEREPQVYGSTTLDQINLQLTDTARSLGHELAILQSNAEHDLVDAIQKAPKNNVAFIIINPAAFTHTSVALRDALLAVKIPFVETHLSNPHAREAFRHRSFLADIAVGTLSGFGAYSYQLALHAADHYLKQR